MRIGLLGCGQVGTAVVEALEHNGAVLAARTGRAPVLARIAIRHPAKRRGRAINPALLTTDTWSVIRDPEVDVIVEAIGGTEPASCYLAEALVNGKSVVTANKQLVSAYGLDLAGLAARSGRVFAFEGSVGAALPVVRVLRDALAGDRVRRLVGVINGTANFILTAMEAGAQLDEALLQARTRGLTEPDPADDLSGRDVAAKLAILIGLAFGARARAHQIPCRGIAHITPEEVRAARDAGTALRLLAVARRSDGGVEAGVFPAAIAQTDPLAHLRGEENGVLIDSDLAGELYVRGRGAGGRATASAILGDLAAVAAGIMRPLAAETVPVLPLAEWDASGEAAG